jgi:hypothetical protein
MPEESSRRRFVAACTAAAAASLAGCGSGGGSASETEGEPDEDGTDEADGADGEATTSTVAPTSAAPTATSTARTATARPTSTAPPTTSGGARGVAPDASRQVGGPGPRDSLEDVVDTGDGFVAVGQYDDGAGKPPWFYGFDRDLQERWSTTVPVDAPALLYEGTPHEGGVVAAGDLGTSNLDPVVVRLDSNHEAAWTVRQRADAHSLTRGITSVGGDVLVVGGRIADGMATGFGLALTAGGEQVWSEPIVPADAPGSLLNGAATHPDGAVVAGAAQVRSGGTRPWVAGLDASGAVRWEHTFADVTDGYVKSVRRTPRGNYAFVGATSQSASGEGFVGSMTAAGDVRWTDRFGYEDGPVTLLDVGPFNVDGIVGAGAVLGGGATTDGLVVVYGLDGDPLGATRYHGQAVDVLAGAVPTSDGHAFAAGVTDYSGGSGDGWLAYIE